MTIKINTWINTYDDDFKKNPYSTNFSLDLKNFDYQGKPINRIEVRNGDKSRFKKFIAYSDQGWSQHNRRVEIELDENKIKFPTAGYGSHLIVERSAITSIKEWKMPTEFRFKMVGWEDSTDGTFRFKIEEKGLAEGSYTPMVNYIEMPFNKNQLADYELYLSCAENRDKELIISNIEWEAHGGGEAVELNNGELKLGVRWTTRNIMPKIKVVGESKNFPHPDEKQASSREEAIKKVSAVIERAKKASKKLFEFGYINKNKEDFQEAVQSISELMKIAKNGSEEEKKEYKTYNAWQADIETIFVGGNGVPSQFKELKNCIHYTSINNGKNWKYNLDTGEVDWGSTDQSESSQGQGDQNNDNLNNDKGDNKKRKNDENDNGSREPKRAKVGEVGENEKIKNEVEQDISKKDEEVSNKIDNSLQGLSEATDEEKKKKLADIEKLKNQGKVSEEKEQEIAEKKNELAKTDPQGYGRMMAKVLEQKIAEFKVEIDKLGQAIKEKLNQLKSGEFTDDTEVRQVEEEVSVAVSEEVANVELKGFISEAQKVLKSTANNLQQQIEEMKKKLYSFKFSTNIFQQKAYQAEKDTINKLEKDLENYSTNNTTQPPKSGFFRPEVVIPLSLAVVLVAAVAILVVRKRKQAKVK